MGMNLERINIGDEIYINFVESDKFKTNYIDVNLISRLEDNLKASKNALLVKVLKRGSKNFPTMADINKRLNYLYAAKIGAGVSKAGEAQIISFSANMLENKYALGETNIMDETIGIFGDIFLNPLIEDGGFRQEYAEGEKINLTNDILAQINNKTAYSYQKCVEIMCENERFAINNLGSVESVKLTDGKNLYAHYNYILSNCAIEIFCVGKFAEKKQFITDKFKEMLKDIKRDKTTEKYDSDIILKANYKGETVEEMEVNQGKLAIGFRTGISNKDKNFADFVMFDAVYGLTPTGKLFQNVREKLSLCYYCSTRTESAKGIMTVLCGIENENKQKASDEILNQLEEMKAGNFTDKDIEAAKLSVINSYKEAFDSAGDITYWYLRRIMCGNIKTPDEMIAEINKVEKQDIINAAKNITLDSVYFLKGTLLNNSCEETEEE